jgi:hypothetical protein
LLPSHTRPIASAKLPDGRILQIEGITYGIRHHMGQRSLVEPIQPWLPQQIVQFFAPQYPRSEIALDRPGLVVWVNAVDAVTGKYVDCQSIRLEFVDEQGDLFGQDTSSWSGSPSFWRCGHIFNAFPRTQHTLTLQVSCWKNQGLFVSMQFPNPQVAVPAHWLALPLPQCVPVGDLEVELTKLVKRTHGEPKQYWQTPCEYWEPKWKLHRNGEDAVGWGAPKWTAADPTGNHGQFLGTRQPVLRFSAEFYPSTTNLADSIVLGRLAPVRVAPLQTNSWTNLTLTNGSTRFTVLGLFAPGTYVFTSGALETNPAIRMGPTQGGAPSGWVGQSKRISPTQVQHRSGHYTPVPVVYILAPDTASKDRLGLRLRDEQGRCWLAKAESQGSSQGIWPFLVELPPDVATTYGEVVLLKPVQAEFTVQTSAPAQSPDVPERSREQTRGAPR